MKTLRLLFSFLLLSSAVGAVPLPRPIIEVSFELDVSNWRSAIEFEMPIAEFENEAAEKLVAVLDDEIRYFRFVTDAAGENVAGKLRVRLYAVSFGQANQFRPTFFGFSVNGGVEDDGTRIPFRIGDHYSLTFSRQSALGGVGGSNTEDGELKRVFAAELVNQDKLNLVVKALSQVPVYKQVYFLKIDHAGVAHHFCVLPWSCADIHAGGETEIRIKMADPLGVVREHRTGVATVNDNFRDQRLAAAEQGQPAVNPQGIVLQDPAAPHPPPILKHLTFPPDSSGWLTVQGIHIHRYAKSCQNGNNDDF